MGSVDIIGTVVSSLRAGRAYGRRISKHGAWSMHFPRFAGTGFHVVLAGEGRLTAAGMEPVTVHPGDVVLVPHGAEHALGHVSATTGFEFFCGVYRLGQVPLHPYLGQMPAVVVHPRGEGDVDLRDLADFVDRDVTRPAPGEQVMRAALVDLVVVHLLRRTSEERRTDAWPAAADSSIAPALRALHDAPHEQWTLERLSTACAMSRGAFSRRFASVVGTPPMKYLAQLRLAGGARLLRETGEPLDAIARKVGYSTGFAFAHAFRREYGLAPGRYRSERGAQMSHPRMEPSSSIMVPPPAE